LSVANATFPLNMAWAKEKADGQAQPPCEESSIGLKNHHPHQHRTEADSMPSPFGEGQTDTPINRRNRGEVPYDPSVG